MLAYVAPAQAQLTAPLPTRTSVTDSSESTQLKPGDLVRISVIGFPEFSGEQTITIEGSVYLPMAGEVSVVGLPTEGLIRRLETALKPYIRRPQVNLTLISASPLRVSVTGEVIAPGPRLLEPEVVSNSNVIKLSEVLIAAGGVTPEADLRNIVIYRQSEPGAALQRSHNDSAIPVNLWEVVQTGDLSADPIIRDGDEIAVPSAATSSAEQQILLSSTLAPETIIVNVSGEVRSPGPVEISPAADANAAIAAAGGPTPDANTGSILLARMGDNGQLVREEFEFGQRTKTIRNGDLIHVKKSATSNALDFFDAIASPFLLLLDLF